MVCATDACDGDAVSALSCGPCVSGSFIALTRSYTADGQARAADMLSVCGRRLWRAGLDESEPVSVSGAPFLVASWGTSGGHTTTKRQMRSRSVGAAGRSTGDRRSCSFPVVSANDDDRQGHITRVIDRQFSPVACAVRASASIPPDSGRFVAMNAIGGMNAGRTTGTRVLQGVSRAIGNSPPTGRGARV